MSSQTPRTALVIAPNGGFGDAAAKALLAHGWSVRGLARRPPADPRIQFAPGDAASAEDVRAAAEGVQLIVQAANPPAYRNWPTLVPAFAEAALAGARASGARLVYPAACTTSIRTTGRWSPRTRRRTRAPARAGCAARSRPR